ncbi:MAG: glycosyltransferase family 2 protein [Chloroflexi bacterium]|nr:MAG: glycosyltransferase family 2 protein [Chloroflexota bacterium]
MKTEEKLSVDALPMVTIMMPVRNEAAFIAQTLDSILAQNYPAELMEIVIADGRSTDNTREIIASLQQQHANIHLIDNPSKIAPTGLNVAIRQAQGDVIVRVDGHAILDPDYVRSCVAQMQQTGADCVGGAWESRGKSYVGKAIAQAMSSRFGIGNSGFRVASTSAPPRIVDTVPFGAYRRDVFERIGLFNEKMVRHQDYELCYRLRQAGGRILLLPEVRAVYYVRATLAKLWRQYWQYGIWKGRFLRVYPASLKLRHMMPPLFVFAVVVSSLLSLIVPSWGWLAGAVLGAYALFLLVALLNFVFRGKSKYLPLLPVIIACLHLSWGIGVWIGLLTPSPLEDGEDKMILVKAE